MFKRLAVISFLCISVFSIKAQPNLVSKSELPQAAGTNANKSTAIPSRLIGNSNYQNNGNNRLVLHDSTAYTYANAQIGLISSASIYNANSPGNAVSKINYIYDTRGNNTEISSVNFDAGTGGYNNFAKLTKVYDANSWLLSSTYQQVDSLFIFRNVNRHNYIYDNRGNRIDDILQSWNFSSLLWENATRQSVSFNNLNKIISQTYYTTASGNTWKQQTRYTYTYDQTDTVILADTILTWSTIANAWINNTLVEYQLNSSHLAVSAKLKTWFEPGSYWTIVSQIDSFAYNQDGLQTSSIELNWNLATQTFEYNTRKLTEYNNLNQITSIATHSHNNGYWNVGGGTKANYYYQSYLPTEIKPLTLGDDVLLVRPIPADENLDVDIILSRPQECQLFITDLLGRVVMKIPLLISSLQHLRLSTSELLPGSFILSLCTKDGAVVSKSINIHH